MKTPRKSWRERCRHGLYRLRYPRPLSNALIDYEDVFSQILREATTEDQMAGLPDLDFGWHCNIETFNAMTWLSRSQANGHIRLWVGCLSELQSLSNAIFRSTDCFVDIGDAKTNNCSFAEILQGHEQELNQDISGDPIRAESGHIVAEIGLAMIALHEVGHHAHNHKPFYPRGFKFAEHQQSHSTTLPSEALIKQACELEADDFGLVYILGKASQMQSPFSTQLVSEDLQDHLFSLAILAYSLVIAFLHDADYKLEAYEDWDHPHPAVRLYASQLNFAPYLQNKPEVLQAFQNGLAESLRILQHGALQQTTLNLLLNERDRLQERTQVLTDALTNARERLTR